MEGTGKGYDIELVKSVTDVVSIPVIASGGMGKLEDLKNVINQGQADAVAMAHVLHYGHHTVENVRHYCIDQNIPVRLINHP